MLSIIAPGAQRNCEGISRREMLKIGTLGLGGLSLSQLLQTKSLAGADSPVKDKAVVVLFLQGGPTHVETFDPKMTAPAEYRAMFGEVATRLPGVTLGSTFPLLANLAHKLAIVRSFRHGNSSHASASALVASGGNPTQSNMGSLYSRLAGLNHPTSGMPSNTVLPPPAAGAKYKDLGAQTERVTQFGTLGSAYRPFDPSAGSEITRNMELKIPRDRLDDRRQLLGALDQLRRQTDANDSLAGYNNFQRQAFDVILGGVASAFDLSKEDARTLAAYDTSHCVIPPAVLKRKKNTVERSSPVALGRQMLMARRLCEAGCGYVTVTSAGWDMHGNSFGIDDGIPCLGPAVDKAVSAFIQDVEDRGLSNKILLVVTGEFGRTPKINNKGGRDHWGNLCPLLLSGGGLNMGQVIGQSDSRVSVPASDPYEPEHLLGTIMHTLFDIGTLRVVPGVPRDILAAVENTRPIPALV